MINSYFTNNTANRDGGAINMDSGTVSNCNFIKNVAQTIGGAIVIRSGSIVNCNFTDNKVTGLYGIDGMGGAIYGFGYDIYDVINCNFTNNNATEGGAVYFVAGSTGNVISCNFDNNTAKDGGAIRGNSAVTNCNFTNNKANEGFAITLTNNGTISNSRFLNNKAHADVLEMVSNGSSISIFFKGYDSFINAINSVHQINFTNVTYWGANGITTISSAMSGSNYEAGQNITVKGVINGKSVDMTLVTDGEGKIVINDVHDYLIVVIHDDDSYYTGSQKLFTNMNLNVNVTYQICYDKTVNLTAKSNILTDLVRGRFVLSNGTEINATYASNGTWWAVYTFDDYGEYNVSASFYDYNEYNPTGSYIHDVYVTNPFIKLNDVHVNSGLISIYKSASLISTVNVTVEYADSINFTVETEGATGITAEMDGGDVVVVDNFTVVLNGLSIGNYTLTVTTIPDGDHNSVKGSIIVHVIMAPAKIIVENDTMEMNVLDIRSINATLSPAGEGTFTYVSNNSDVVVAAGGKLIALREGNAKITVSFAGNENYYAAENKTIIVKVTLKNTSVSVVNSTLDLKVGDEFELGAISIPGILNVHMFPVMSLLLVSVLMVLLLP